MDTPDTFNTIVPGLYTTSFIEQLAEPADYCATSLLRFRITPASAERPTDAYSIYVHDFGFWGWHRFGYEPITHADLARVDAGSPGALLHLIDRAIHNLIIGLTFPMRMPCG